MTTARMLNILNRIHTNTHAQSQRKDWLWDVKGEANTLCLNCQRKHSHSMESVGKYVGRKHIIFHKILHNLLNSMQVVVLRFLYLIIFRANEHVQRVCVCVHRKWKTSLTHELTITPPQISSEYCGEIGRGKWRMLSASIPCTSIALIKSYKRKQAVWDVSGYVFLVMCVVFLY